MIRDGNGIEVVLQRLLHPNARPHIAIGKDRVHMEIAFERFVTRHIREVELSSIVEARMRTGHRQSKKGKQR